MTSHEKESGDTSPHPRATPSGHSDQPRVSVLMLAYNHEAYIRQAVESALGQETAFDLEVVVAEDCSHDNTRGILLELSHSHPERLRLILQPANVGMLKNLAIALEACRGEFVALLEGDDYWTSPHKLQTQVDFLDAHPDCVICHHNVERIDERHPDVRSLWHPPRHPAFETLDDLLQENRIVTCSAVFRNGLWRPLPAWFVEGGAGDWPLHVLNARHGRIGYLPDVMAVYRVHAGGVWSSRSDVERFGRLIHTAELMKQELNPRQRRILERTIGRRHADILEALIREGRGDAALEHVRRNDLPRGGYRRLRRFYEALSQEQSGRRWRAAGRLVGALVCGWGQTRVGSQDVLLALFRNALPGPYRMMRGAFRRLNSAGRPRSPAGPSAADRGSAGGA
ncbi:MAG TPA: glycosyltransferase [Planctomycetaceae bacterium]|nr:glycosyltransferase [Planctomycetaceae bacterium]